MVFWGGLTNVYNICFFWGEIFELQKGQRKATNYVSPKSPDENQAPCQCHGVMAFPRINFISQDEVVP